MAFQFHPREFAFYSEELAKAGAKPTFVQRNGTDEVLEANHFGEAWNGKPGKIENGKLVRPENFERYKLVGEIDSGAGKFLRVPPSLHDWYDGQILTQPEPKPSARVGRKFLVHKTPPSTYLSVYGQGS
jgi:hypothetical protein